MEILSWEKECPACKNRTKHGRVLIKPDKQPDRTDAGIFLPDKTDEDITQWGDVIDISADLKDDPVKPGMRCFFEKNHGDPVWQDGVYHLIISRDKLLAVV